MRAQSSLEVWWCQVVFQTLYTIWCVSAVLPRTPLMRQVLQAAIGIIRQLLLPDEKC